MGQVRINREVAIIEVEATGGTVSVCFHEREVGVTGESFENLMYLFLVRLEAAFRLAETKNFRILPTPEHITNCVREVVSKGLRSLADEMGVQ